MADDDPLRGTCSTYAEMTAQLHADDDHDEETHRG